MSTTNQNAARKIERAIRKGWTGALLIGPCRFARLGRHERRHALGLLRHRRPDNAWRGVPVMKEAA